MRCMVSRRPDRVTWLAAAYSTGASSTTSSSSSDSGSSTSRAAKDVRETIEPFDLSVAMGASDQCGFAGWSCEGEVGVVSQIR